MALREFADHDGRQWSVWDVYPRRTFDTRLHTRTGNAGWLAFECATTGERRRVHPVPHAWAELLELELIALWYTAVVVPPRRRLIE